MPGTLGQMARYFCGSNEECLPVPLPLLSLRKMAYNFFEFIALGNSRVHTLLYLDNCKPMKPRLAALPRQEILAIVSLFLIR
jgi:hypothetical protein